MNRTDKTSAVFAALSRKEALAGNPQEALRYARHAMRTGGGKYRRLLKQAALLGRTSPTRAD